MGTTLAQSDMELRGSTTTILPSTQACNIHGDDDNAHSDTTKQRNLAQDEDDLQLWLDHTGFFDLQYRKEILASVRELKAIELAKAKVMMRIRNSRPSRQPQADAVSTPLHAPESASQYQPTTSSSPSLTPSSIRYYQGERGRPEGARAEKQPHSPVSQPFSLRTAPNKKNTRYFLVKSLNMTNVYMSQKDGLWVTQTKNGALFRDAFRTCRSVVLFFSVNKSKAFQGYAKMTSAPDGNITRPGWINTTMADMSTTFPFHVSWLNAFETPFDQFGDLKNHLYEDRPVFFGRDGQEYPDECGVKMLEIMDRAKAAAEGLRSSPTATPLSPSDSIRKAYMCVGAEDGHGGAGARAASSASAGRSGATRSEGLSGSRWKRNESEIVVSSLDSDGDARQPETVNEYLLLDYP